MKISFLIYCMALFSGALAQEKHPRDRTDFKCLVLGGYNYIYTRQNSAGFYEQAKSLIELDNPDSSYKASMIMWGLFLFDTTNYSLKNCRPWLDKIIASNTRYYENNLRGAWRFSHDYWTGMGISDPTTTTAIDTGKVIKLDGHMAYFLFNDSLIRQTPYKIVVKQTGFYFQRINRYTIHFDDKNEDWLFRLTQAQNDPTPLLTITLNPLCSCGCGEDIYKKTAAAPQALTKREF